MFRLAVAFSLFVAALPRAALGADLDGDDDTDLGDFAAFQVEFTGPEPVPLPSPADFNMDGRVDLADYRIFLEGFDDSEIARRPASNGESQPLGRTLFWLLLFLLMNLCFQENRQNGAQRRG